MFFHNHVRVPFLIHSRLRRCARLKHEPFFIVGGGGGEGYFRVAGVSNQNDFPTPAEINGGWRSKMNN